jgi:hypothetical protein
MKKTHKPRKDEMRKEYDFSGGVRGKHAARYAEGTTVVLLDSKRPHYPETEDSQLTELAGKHLLIAQLTAAGLEVAVPVRDRGIDLIAYLDRGTPPRDFVACPIQLKASTGEGFGLDKKYEKTANLILAYVWHVTDPVSYCIYALSYREALAILHRKGHTATTSWENGYWHVTRADKQLIRMLEPYKMTPKKWVERVSSALLEESDARPA